MRRLALAAAAALILAEPAVAQPAPAAPPPPPCATAEHRQLDFWVGDWELEFDLPNGGKGKATNRITRDAFGSCAIVEHFVQPGGGPGGADYVGGSYSAWDPQTGRWRQMWVDNAGTPFVLVGGPVSGQPHVFELVTTEPRGPTPDQRKIRRMIWEQVTPDSLVWRWQAQEADGGWSDSWVLRYRRKGTATTGGN